MVEYSRLNDPKMYQNCDKKNLMLPAASVPAFAVQEGERVCHSLVPFNQMPFDEIYGQMDMVDIAITEEVARSKYLTSLQIYEYLGLRGIYVKRDRIRKKIVRLMKMRVIQEKSLNRPVKECGLRYYGLDVKGYQIAKELGVTFHMGNRYLSFRKMEETGTGMAAKDVKRILAGNQIVLGLLLSGAKMERFGIMETLRVDMEFDDQEECILRTAAIVKVDAESVLAYEVARDCAEAYEKLADKVRRYYKLVHNEQYLSASYHGDRAFPQLVICGESLEHNQKIVNYLKSAELWNEEDTILFTEDLLNMGDSLRSIYAIGEDGRICWYSLPGNGIGRGSDKRLA